MKRARNGIRTRTSLRMPPPQDGASANFATQALCSLKDEVKSLKSLSDFGLST